MKIQQHCATSAGNEMDFITQLFPVWLKRSVAQSCSFCLSVNVTVSGKQHLLGLYDTAGQVEYETIIEQVVLKHSESIFVILFFLVWSSTLHCAHMHTN